LPAALVRLQAKSRCRVQIGCTAKPHAATLLISMAIARDNSPERLVSATRAEEEQGFELKLRPRWLGEFIGQAKAKEQLAIALEAAKSRGEALDHVLLFGPPGLGKTTLATIIANELDVGFQQTSGPALQIQGDLTAILTTCARSRCCFWMRSTACSRCWKKNSTPRSRITSWTSSSARPGGAHPRDEIRPSRSWRDYAARAPIVAAAITVGILLRLEFYSEEDLRFIVTRSAEVMGVPIDQDGARRLRCARAVHHALPTACCAACATMRRCAAQASSTGQRPTPP